MWHRADPELTKRTRGLRDNPTPPERAIWHATRRGLGPSSTTAGISIRQRPISGAQISRARGGADPARRTPPFRRRPKSCTLTNLPTRFAALAARRAREHRHGCWKAPPGAQQEAVERRPYYDPATRDQGAAPSRAFPAISLYRGAVSLFSTGISQLFVAAMSAIWGLWC